VKFSSYLEGTKGRAQQLKLLSRDPSPTPCVSEPMPGNGCCLLAAERSLTITSDKLLSRQQLATCTQQMFWQKALMGRTLRVNFPNEVHQRAFTSKLDS